MDLDGSQRTQNVYRVSGDADSESGARFSLACSIFELGPTDWCFRGCFDQENFRKIFFISRTRKNVHHSKGLDALIKNPFSFSLETAVFKSYSRFSNSQNGLYRFFRKNFLSPSFFKRDIFRKLSTRRTKVPLGSTHRFPSWNSQSHLKFCTGRRRRRRHHL